MMERRKKAWETRRKKYGERGHSGSYSCGSQSSRIKHMETELIKLHIDGVLSEGQVCKMTLLDRVSMRTKADNITNLKETK